MPYIDKWKATQDPQLATFRSKSAMLKTTVDALELMAVNLEGSAPALFIDGYRAAIEKIEEIKREFERGNLG
tara:strand:+ start:1408 stop:1623 length:216 start_codon:yes stop_codon:yes gene_type:complete